jgi:ADP-heptose:LPS heptosyltransferase
MIISCGVDNEQLLKKADLDIFNLSKNILRKKIHISFRRSLKDTLKSFSSSLKFFASKNNISKVYIAIIISGGMGDILRQMDALFDILEMFPNAVVDLYGKAYRHLFSDIGNIRFIFNRYFIGFSRKRYDIVLDYFSSDNITSGICDLTVNSLRTNSLKSFKADFEYLKTQYPYCFKFENQYFFQKKAVENKLKFNNVVKLTAGIKNFTKIALPLNFREQDILKFGLSKQCKYITFQHGWGNKGYIPNKMQVSTHLWETKSWKELLKEIKIMFPGYKIVQVGLASPHITCVDINLVGKTSFDELCSVLKYSSLHIDTDGGCVHLAKAVNTKSVVLFGPSNAEYVGYDDNINIVATSCRNCFVIEKWHEKCLRGFKTPICMQSILPNFVADVIKNNLGGD